ncbi:metallophosphoesterase family protein [Paenibacillus contaminans]|uniref:Metallophosphoesterase n=1 Tax=Paenibacillus contaminans TaxID=450362 RepID=A0A329MDB2_9BACL|nr:metallophosphoesterase [Paenibacillus contaminans]RAV17904.1 metallophosphoesterase [Paenibacillus contaminans]
MRFVLMGDFHYSRMENGTEEMLDARDNAYTVMLDAFLNMDADYHISLGDLTHEGYPEELGSVFQKIGAGGRSFIHVLGNHDAYSIPKAEILAITGQQRYRAIHTDEASLIFLDTTKEMNREDWGGEMDAEQLEWLQIQLDQSGEKPAFVFAHHPVYGTTARSTMEKLSIHPDIDMKAVLHRKKGPGFFFCGHNHVNSIVRQENWHYVQTAACLDIPAYRTVELENGKVKIGLVLLEEADLAEHIALFHTKMPGFAPTPEAHGEDSDRNLFADMMESVK